MQNNSQWAIFIHLSKWSAKAICNGVHVKRIMSLACISRSYINLTEQSCLPFKGHATLHNKFPQWGWFTLYKLKMSNLARCKFFCVQNLAYKNHLYSRPNPILYTTHWTLTTPPPLEESYALNCWYTKSSLRLYMLYRHPKNQSKATFFFLTYFHYKEWKHFVNIPYLSQWKANNVFSQQR